MEIAADVKKVNVNLKSEMLLTLEGDSIVRYGNLHHFESVAGR